MKNNGEKKKMQSTLSKKTIEQGYPRLNVNREKLKSKALIAPVDENGDTILDPKNDKHRAWFNLLKE